MCKGLFTLILCVFEKFHSKDRVKKPVKGEEEEKEARMVSETWPGQKGFSQCFCKRTLLELVTARLMTMAKFNRETGPGMRLEQKGNQQEAGGSETGVVGSLERRE